MTQNAAAQILTHSAPGEFRAAFLFDGESPSHLYIERWGSVGDHARFGASYRGRIRAFRDELKGAFVELDHEEEAFLRLKSREGLTEGQAVSVIVRSEMRADKLARVALIPETRDERVSNYQRWRAWLGAETEIEAVEAPEQIDAIFDQARASSVTLPGGGQLHIERTRALTAFDIDTSGRIGKGSAGARALSLNKVAAAEMIRQSSLRGLGGNLVLDCVAPLNTEAGTRIRAEVLSACRRLGIERPKVLKPSALGLLEASLPWRYMPLEDILHSTPGETELLLQLRQVQREATANPMNLYQLSFGGLAWQAYLSRKTEADKAVADHFGARVSIVESATSESRIDKR